MIYDIRFTIDAHFGCANESCQSKRLTGFVEEGMWQGHRAAMSPAAFRGRNPAFSRIWLRRSAAARTAQRAIPTK